MNIVQPINTEPKGVKISRASHVAAHARDADVQGGTLELLAGSK